MASSEETQPALNCAEEQEDKMDCKEESNTGLEEKGVAVEGGMEEEDGKVDASEKDAQGCPEEKNEGDAKAEEAKISETESVAIEDTDSKNPKDSQVEVVDTQVESGEGSGEIDSKVDTIPLESGKVSDVQKNEDADKDKNEGIGEQIIDKDIKDEAVGVEIGEELVSTGAERGVVEGKEVDADKENSQEAEQTVPSTEVEKDSVCVENEESVSSGTKTEIHVQEDGEIDEDSMAKGSDEVKKDEVVENGEDAVILEIEDKALGHSGKETEVQNEEISVKIEEGPTEVMSEEVVREEVVREEVKEVVVLEMEDLVSGQTGQETKVQSVSSAGAAVGGQSEIGNLDEVKLDSVVVETENETGMLALTESVDLEIEEGTEVSDLCENPVEGGTEKVTAVTVEYDSVVTEHKDGDVGRETENESSSPAAGVVAVADADEDVVVSETGKKIAVSEIEREMLVIDDGRPGFREVVEEDVTVVEEEVPVVIEYGDDAVVVETTEGVFITNEDKVEDSEAFTIIEHDAVTEVTDEPPVALEEEEIIEEPVMDVIDDTVVITEVQRGGGGGGGPPDDEGGIGMKIMGPISGGDQQSGAGSNTSAVIPNSSDGAGACSTKEGCGKGSGEGTGRCGEMDKKGGVGVDAHVTGCKMGCEVTLCDNDAKSKPTLVREDNNQNIIKEQTSCGVDTVNEKVTEKKTGVIMRKKQKATENENGSTPEVEDDGIGPCARKKFPQLFGKHMTDAYLQQKIDYEIKMRDGTAKLLAASKHPHQMLEAAKNLLTSNSRMIAYMSELQKRKTEEVLKKRRAEDGNQLPCKARVCVSDIRIPLMWRDTDHFKNRGDHRRYAVFCIWKIGTEIYDTTLLKDVDRSMTDITFDDVIVFNDIPHDFVCSVEIYCHKLYEDLTIASTPRRLKKKINEFSTSVGRSVGKRLSGMKDDTEFMANMLVGPKFEKIAEGTLRVSDISDTIATYDLTLFNGNNSDSANIELPLFGNFCCRFAAQPYCLEQETVKGHLELKMTLEDEVIWQRYYCVLKNLAVTCWMSEGDVDENSPPCLTIPITKDCQISHATPGSNKDHQHSFHIAASSRRYNTKSYTLCADTEQQFSAWWDGLQQHMLDQALWQHVCDKKMEISSASPQKLPNFMRRGARPVSLYDATTYKAEKAEDSPMSKILARLHVDDDIPPHSVRKRSEGDDNSRRSIISDTNRSSMCDSKDSRSSTCESKGSRSSTYESKSSSNSESGKISSDDEDSKRSSFRSTASSCSAASGSMASCSEASSTPDTPPPVIKECVRTNSRIETDV